MNKKTAIYKRSKRINTHLFRLVLSCSLILFGTALTACSLENTPQRTKVLYDFEDSSQLDTLIWKCGTVYRRVQKHQSSGRYSLMVEMYPGTEWPGFGMGVRDGWQGYSQLSLHVYNPYSRPISMSYRIDDRRQPSYGDRVNGRVNLKPGQNKLIFDLNKLETSGTGRRLDIKDIRCFLMFMHRPDHKVRIFIDDITLR